LNLETTDRYDTYGRKAYDSVKIIIHFGCIPP
jgi:hypothetical protein